jgi:hypothetical protein
MNRLDFTIPTTLDGVLITTTTITAGIDILGETIDITDHGMTIVKWWIVATRFHHRHVR